MPKTKDAFALRGFDIEQFLQTKLADCGLKPTALKSIDVDRNNFDDLQRAQKSYALFVDELESFEKKIVRQQERLLTYSMTLTKEPARLADDQYYFSILKPRSERTTYLSNRYIDIIKKVTDKKITANAFLLILNQYQRGYYAKIFATRLKEARKTAGLTQAELAAQIGVKRSSYTAFETARNEPNISVLAMLSKKLNRPTDWFLGL